MCYLKQIFIIGVVIAIPISSSAQTSKADENRLIFLEKIYEFGVVKADTLLSARFHFVNVGKDTVHIDYVNPECSCTSYLLSKQDLAPRDTAYIDIAYNTKGKFGAQKAYVIVRANTKEQMYKLTINVDVWDERYVR